MKEVPQYIPALKYKWLTQVYDKVLQITMPERKFKMTLINQMKIEPSQRFLDFGCGSLTLSIMAIEQHPQSEFFGVQLLDGYETTNDNLRGLLQQVMKESNFVAQEMDYFKTAVGTLRLIKGTRI